MYAKEKNIFFKVTKYKGGYKMVIEVKECLFDTIDTQYIDNMYKKNDKFFINLKIEYIELFKILGIIK